MWTTLQLTIIEKGYKRLYNYNSKYVNGCLIHIIYDHITH